MEQLTEFVNKSISCDRISSFTDSLPPPLTSNISSSSISPINVTSLASLTSTSASVQNLSIKNCKHKISPSNLNSNIGFSATDLSLPSLKLKTPAYTIFNPAFHKPHFTIINSPIQCEESVHEEREKKLHIQVIDENNSKDSGGKLQ